MRKEKRLIAWIMAVVMLFTICVFGGNGTAEAAATTPVAKHGRLSVKGADLVDSKGNKFQLRGISTHGINWDVGSPYVNKKAFKTLRDDWGVNAIRLAMYTEEYNGYCSGGSQAKLRKLVDKGVGYATDLGMYAIIDWHILSDGNPNKNKSQAKKFFTTMAKKYKNNKNVIYEICNEPNGDTSWDEIKSYSVDVIDRIRMYAPQSIVIVGTPTWSQDVDIASSSPIERTNLLYSLHFYAATHKEDLQSKMQTALTNGLPVFVSEYGNTEASGNGIVDTTSADTWMKLLNENGIGYIYWNLSNKDEACALLRSSCTSLSDWTFDDYSPA